MPTLALSNSITFAHISDQENDFPKFEFGAHWVGFPRVGLFQ